MATVFEQWKSQQLIDASTMTRTLTQPLQPLIHPPTVRASGMTNTNVNYNEQNVQWEKVDSRGGAFDTVDKKTFTTKIPGIYWVNCMLALESPFKSSDRWTSQDRATDKDRGQLIARVKQVTWSSSTLLLKAFTSTRIFSSYQSVQISGLIFLNSGAAIVVSVQGINGKRSWIKAQSSNPTTALSVFSATLVVPDAVGL